VHDKRLQSHLLWNSNEDDFLVQNVIKESAHRAHSRFTWIFDFFIFSFIRKTVFVFRTVYFSIYFRINIMLLDSDSSLLL
jgi:hypothetical protein